MTLELVFSETSSSPAASQLEHFAYPAIFSQTDDILMCEKFFLLNIICCLSLISILVLVDEIFNVFLKLSKLLQ